MCWAIIPIHYAQIYVNPMMSEIILSKTIIVECLKTYLEVWSMNASLKGEPSQVQVWGR